MSADEDLVAEHLARALELRAAGEPVDVDALCAAHPHVLPLVRDALGLRSDLAGLHDRAAGPAAPVDDPRGRVLAERYRLVECIGQGAVGMVFRAHDERLGRDVAVKLLHHGLFSAPEVEARFRREAEVLAQHEHRHIVRIYDQGTAADGAPFLVTELLDGVSLQTILERSHAAMGATGGPSSATFRATDWLRELLPDAELESSYLRQIVVWIEQLARGLQAAHAAGVYHRDIKPSNVFIRLDGTAVLLDFGIAAREGDAAMTLPHAIVGTPCYMAPEQASGRAEPRPSLDVYGLTATLYHLLTLQPPHEGDLQTVLVAVRTSDPTPAAWLHRGLPRDLAAILDHGLEHDLTRRYPDVAQLGNDVRAFLEHRPVQARPISGTRRFLRSCRRQPARTGSVLLAALLVVTFSVLLPLWATVEAREQDAEAGRIFARLPGDLALEGWPDLRPLVPIGERERVTSELDRLLELDATDLYVRLMRAAERLDGGDRAGAADDFRQVQRLADSPYLLAVAERYEATAMADEATTPTSIDLTGLPEPTTGPDFFVAGFHALRAWDFARAAELLARCDDGFVPARDLRLLALAGQRRPDPDELLSEAAWLEGHYGFETARTLHIRAVASLMRRDYERAVPLCRRSLELRPDRHGPWNNLGLALLRSGELEAARTALERAVSFRPWFANSRANLAQAQRALGDRELAEATLAEMTDVAYREHELGNVDLERAILAGADDAARIAHAENALAHFEAAVVAAEPPAVTRHPRPAAIPAAISYAKALAHEDRRIAAIVHMLRLRRDATNPQQLSNLVKLLEGLPFDDLLRDEVRLFLLEIAAQLAPGKKDILKHRDALRATQKQRR